MNNTSAVNDRLTANIHVLDVNGGDPITRVSVKQFVPLRTHLSHIKVTDSRILKSLTHPNIQHVALLNSILKDI